MFDVARKVIRHRLLRNAAMAALVVPLTLLASCAREEVVAPPAQPVAYQPPPPPPPAPAPAPVIGERD